MATTTMNGPPDEQHRPLHAVSPFKAGTRKSKLALAQAALATNALSQAWPDHEFQIRGLNTAAGDIDKITPFKDMPVKNIWTHDLERLLVEKELDLLVHSLKGKITLKDDCISRPEESYKR